MRDYSVAIVDYAATADALHAVRDAVFVREQSVPAALERDSADPQCLHVLAHAADGQPIGTARLVPPLLAVNGCAGSDADGGDAGLHATASPRIGRMAVLREWRSRGVGEAMLAELTTLARNRGWRELMLHAQAAAIPFYTRLGYLPAGPRFMEAGIEHQSMRRKLDGPAAIETSEEAAATVVALAHATRRRLQIYSRALDPGLFDAPPVLDALRRFAVRGGGIEIRIVLQDAATPRLDHAPLLSLSQRLPSVLLLREVDDPVDRSTPSAFVANDAGGYYFRGLGHRFDGDVDLAAPGRARQLCEEFDRIWERARPCSELRALGL